MAQARSTPRDEQGASVIRRGSARSSWTRISKALEDSFPASDPPAPSQPTGTEPAGDPKVKP